MACLFRCGAVWFTSGMAEQDVEPVVVDADALVQAQASEVPALARAVLDIIALIVRKNGILEISWAWTMC